jgi:regulator of nucleoside diphosphate kinase
MSTRTIYITEYDHQRLRQLINEAGSTDYRGSEYLDNLELELEKGKVVTPKEVPSDVVTMNTKVRLVDLEENDEMEYTLVFPDQADLAQNKISVLAPLGTAMLGYRVGDTFSFQTPSGEAKMKVKEIIYQPEASGDYHL